MVPAEVKRLYWSVQAVDGGFAGSPFSPEQTVSPTTSGADKPALPTVLALHQNSPNPFNPSTTIRFDLARPKKVDHGRTVAAGVYFYVLNGKDFSETRRMAMVK